jgi:threonine aldolase
MKKIDLRSDTVTHPTKEMMDAIMNANIGDDVFEDDQEVKELEQLACQILGKEAAIFVPSGTFSNQLALISHTTPGDEVILDQESHIVLHETAAASQIAKVQLFTLESNHGIWDLEKLKKVIKPGDVFSPKTTLICMENAFNGLVLPITYMQQVYQIANERGVKVHLDGARLFNAATYLKADPRELAKCADSVSICLSKGLCSPVGSILVGSKDLIVKARRFRKMMGGGMRQVGILAAPGKISLTKMRFRLQEDHDLRAYLEKRLQEMPFIKINTIHNKINLLFFTIDHPKVSGLHSYLKQFNIHITPYENGIRFVAHHDVNMQDIDFVVEKMKDYFQ